MKIHTQSTTFMRTQRVYEERQPFPSQIAGCFNLPALYPGPQPFLAREGAVFVLDLGVPCLTWGSLLSSNFYSDLPHYNTILLWVGTLTLGRDVTHSL